MELKTWFLTVRIIHLLSAAMILGFQIWFIVALIIQDRGFFGFTIRIFAPIFMILLGILIIAAQFKYHNITQYFKFIQYLPGAGLLNLFIASIMAFQFSTIDNVAPIVIAILFTLQGIICFVLYCLKPSGSQALLTQQ